MRLVAAVAVLAGLAALPGRCQAPPPVYFVQASPKQFGMSLPASGVNPASQCWVWVRRGGLYDTEVACYVAGVFTGRLETAPAGQGLDGGFTAPGGGWIRLLICNPAAAGCKPSISEPTGWPTGAPTAPMYFEIGAGLGDGSPEQRHSGYF